MTGYAAALIKQKIIWQTPEGQWQRNCPECNKVLHCSNDYHASQAVRNKERCKSCAAKARGYSNNFKRQTDIVSIISIEPKELPVAKKQTVFISDKKIVSVGKFLASNKYDSPLIDLTMIPVTTKCDKCSYILNTRKIPWLPFSIHWGCPVCKIMYITNFKEK